MTKVAHDTGLKFVISNAGTIYTICSLHFEVRTVYTKAFYFTGKRYMAATQDSKAEVILVNQQDIPIGTAEKLIAHQQGLLHRAFSIFIFRKTPSVALLLQQRAATKYHSPNLWTNTCCSHPSPGENVEQAANRRLKEEFNLTIPLRHVGQFHYLAYFDNGLIENELDHVLVGSYQEEEVTPNAAEIQAFRWTSISRLKKEIAEQPEQFTPWLAKALEIAITAY